MLIGSLWAIFSGEATISSNNKTRTAMDPISTLFALYVDAVSNNIHRQVTDTLGTEIQVEVINYEGLDIAFQYQVWQVRERSVCGGYSDDMAVFSDCTTKAKALFNDLCSELTRRQSDHWRFTKTRNMYCNAAVSFKPTIASISRSDELSEVESARRQCNLATAAALGSSDPKLVGERKRACDEYESIR